MKPLTEPSAYRDTISPICRKLEAESDILQLVPVLRQQAEGAGRGGDELSPPRSSESETKLPHIQQLSPKRSKTCLHRVSAGFCMSANWKNLFRGFAQNPDRTRQRFFLTAVRGVCVVQELQVSAHTHTEV